MGELADRMAARGVEALSDRELLTWLLDEDAQAVEALLATYDGSLARIGSAAEARLRMVGGLGLKRARMLRVAAEFGRRAAADGVPAEFIFTSDDVVRLFRPQLERLVHEECWVIYLTASNRIIERQRVSQGGVTGTVVDHRLIVKRALELLATQLILIHNHPSGTPEASPQDRVLTDRVAQAAALFDIRVLDHVIVARDGDFSFRRAGLIGPS